MRKKTVVHMVRASWQARKRSACVESELKMRRAQGREEAAHDQVQENVAAKS